MCNNAKETTSPLGEAISWQSVHLMVLKIMLTVSVYAKYVLCYVCKFINAYSFFYKCLEFFKLHKMQWLDPHSKEGCNNTSNLSMSRTFCNWHSWHRIGASAVFDPIIHQNRKLTSRLSSGKAVWSLLLCQRIAERLLPWVRNIEGDVVTHYQL